jgi:hypothetical protein
MASRYVAKRCWLGVALFGGLLATGALAQPSDAGATPPPDAPLNSAFIQVWCGSADGPTREPREDEDADPLPSIVVVTNSLNAPIRDLAFELVLQTRMDRSLFRTMPPAERQRMWKLMDHKWHTSFKAADRVPQNARSLLRVPANEWISGSVGCAATLTGYRVVRPSGTLLLELVRSHASLDRATAALAIEKNAVDAADRDDAVRAFTEVVNAPASAQGAPGDVAALFAVRALGATGGAKVIPLLLGLQPERFTAHRRALDELRAQQPNHPLCRLLPSGDLHELVEETLRRMPAEVVLPKLTELAFGTDPVLSKRARSVLTTLWPLPIQRAAALRVGVNAQVVDTLCMARQPEAVRLLVLLAASHAEGARARTCIASLPNDVAVNGLISALEDPLGPAGSFVAESLASRGEAAREALQAAARRLDLPDSGSTGDVLQVVLGGSRVRRLQAFRQEALYAGTLAPSALESLDARERAFTDAFTKLEELASLCSEDGDRTEVARGYLTLGTEAARLGEPGHVTRALDALPPLRGATELQPLLFSLGEALVSQLPSRLDLLDRVASLSTDKPSMGKLYVTLAEQTTNEDTLDEIAEHALPVTSEVQASRDRARLSVYEQWTWQCGAILGVIALAVWMRRPR